MDAIEALLTRTSVIRLTEPAPDGDDLDVLLRAALRAPDHKCLRPWRFLVVRGDALDRLGEVFARALEARQPGVGEDALERERKRPRRAPLVVVVVTRPQEGVAGVPVVEQVLSTGAAAENILLAAHALGYGGAWRTGAPAYDPFVHQGLGLGSGESIAGFLYLGTPVGPPGPLRATAEPAAVVEEWTGMGA